MLEIEKIKNNNIKNKYIMIRNLCTLRQGLDNEFNELIKSLNNDFDDEELMGFLEDFIVSFVPMTNEDKTAECFYSILYGEKIKISQDKSTFPINITYVSPVVLDKIPFILNKNYTAFTNDYYTTVETDGKISVDSRTNYTFEFASAQCYVEKASIIWFYQNYDSFPIYASVFVDNTKNLSDLDVVSTCGKMKEYAVYNCYSKNEKVKGILKIH